MTLPNLVTQYTENGELKGGRMGGRIGGQIGGAIQLTTRQKEILSLIEDNTQISKR